MPASSRTPTRAAAPTARWSVGGLLLEAIASRDLPRLADCFEGDATMRALLPSGPAAFTGPDEIIGRVPQVVRERRRGSRCSTAPSVTSAAGCTSPGGSACTRRRKGDDRWHVIEQQAFAHAGERITSMDLLCSGFLPEDEGAGGAGTGASR